MEVIDLKEQEDGSAILTVETTKEESEFLIGYAVRSILTSRINEMKIDEEIERVRNENNICSPVSE